MKTKVYRRYRFTPGPFVTYSIDCRKVPIVEFYNLDSGYLVLYASMTGGYLRKTYKSKSAAQRWIHSYIIRFCQTYWPKNEIEIIPII